jgi:hypothetical protein
MGIQLVLIEDSEPEWRLDDHTVEIGRRGVAAARAAVAAAGHREPDGPGHPGHHTATRHAA